LGCLLLRLHQQVGKKTVGFLFISSCFSKNFNTNFGVRIIMEKIIGTGI
jgi:hypothetical protein